jgi:hypothetical protein
MRRIVGIASAFAILATLTAAWRAIPSQHEALQGAWVLNSITNPAGEVNSEPQRGLFVFTGTHYSMMFVAAAEERQQFAGDSATDAELLAAYRSIIANSGRYEMNGDQISYRAYVAKNPNYMGDWPENETTVTVRIEGDTLTWTWPSLDDTALPGGQMTFRRVEGQPAPW